MIRVTVELWPDGNQSGRRTLAKIDISNISQLAPISDYDYKLLESRNGVPHQDEGLVVKHNRDDGVLKLLHLVLSTYLSKKKSH